MHHIQNCKLPCNRKIFKTRSKLSGSGINYNATYYYHMDLFRFEQRGCTVISAPETSKVLGHTQSASFWTSFIQDADRYDSVLKLNGEPQQRCSMGPHPSVQSEVSSNRCHCQSNHPTGPEQNLLPRQHSWSHFCLMLWLLQVKQHHEVAVPQNLLCRQC